MRTPRKQFFRICPDPGAPPAHLAGSSPKVRKHWRAVAGARPGARRPGHPDGTPFASFKQLSSEVQHCDTRPVNIGKCSLPPTHYQWNRNNIVQSVEKGSGMIAVAHQRKQCFDIASMQTRPTKNAQSSHVFREGNRRKN